MAEDYRNKHRTMVMRYEEGVDLFGYGYHPVRLDNFYEGENNEVHIGFKDIKSCYYFLSISSMQLIHKKKLRR